MFSREFLKATLLGAACASGAAFAPGGALPSGVAPRAGARAGLCELNMMKSAGKKVPPPPPPVQSGHVSSIPPY